MRLNKLMMGVLREEAGEHGEGGGDGGGETPWYQSAGFSEDVLKDEAVSGVLSKYKTPDDFAKGVANLNAKIGAKGIIPPGENATDEERSSFFNQLGRPESPDKYSWKPGEGAAFDQEVFAENTAKLHEAGLTNAQYGAVMDMYAAEVARVSEAFQSTQAEIAKETEGTLKQEWGKDYDSRVKAAAKVAEKFGVIDAFKESGIINQISVIKMLDEVARSTREDGVEHGGSNTGTVEEQLAALKAHPGWNDKMHPEHRDLVKRSVELRAKL